MALPKELQHRRTHNLLLVSKLLSCRENASPFTLVLDTLEQSGRPLTRDIITRAKASKVHTIYVSFETLRKPQGIDTFIYASNFNSSELQRKVASYLGAATRSLVLFDTLHPILSQASLNIPSFLSSFMSPTSSLLAVYHTDIPITSAQSSLLQPHPLVLLKYLATAILTVYSLHHILAQKSARDKSQAEPVFGLAEETEGALVGLGSNDNRGVVLEMEYRRKSGRGVKEWFMLLSAPAISPSHTALNAAFGIRKIGTANKDTLILLEDHPLYMKHAEVENTTSEGLDSTFNLSLTEKQRRDREGVVLPYFDAQKDGGIGEGGRILYDMGAEDDFDEEEDEI